VFQSTAKRLRTLLQPDSATLLAGALFMLLFAMLAIQPLQPADFWWHLKVGEVVLDEGRIPQSDLFTYTVPDSPYIYQGWLAGVVFVLLYHLGGPGLIVVANALLITLAYGILWAICHQAGQHPHLATGCTFAALVVSAGNWAARPQTFSTFLFALFLLILLRFRRGQRAPLWLLPPLTALWANLHGAFVLGPALLGASLVGEVGKTMLPGRPFPVLPRSSRLKLLAATFAALVAPIANPIGWRIFGYVRSIQSNAIIRRFMAEWKPPRIDEAIGAVFFLSVLALFLLLLYRRHRPDPVEALWLVGMTWLALGGVRSILWYSFVMAVLGAQALAIRSAARPIPTERWQARVNLTLLGILFLLALLTLPWFKGILPLPLHLQGAISYDTPVQTADFIESEALKGRIFHRMEYGGYLFWRFYPERRVFIDSRVELFPSRIWDEYGLVSDGAAGTEALLEDHGVEILLLDTRFQAGLVEWAQNSARWQPRYENPAEYSTIFTRQPLP
jgi:hypothetical protein